jgi:hypothetical protein
MPYSEMQLHQTTAYMLNPYAEMVKGYSEYNASTLQTQIELKQDLKVLTQGLNVRLMTYARRYSYFDVSRSYNPFYYAASEQPNGTVGLQVLTRADKAL